ALVELGCTQGQGYWYARPMSAAGLLRWLPRTAARAVIDEIGELGGIGGVIVVTPDGDGGWAFNAPGMYRGIASPEGRKVAIYGDE
ncbi:MAG: isoaspartyl peptidase/L-asparaginase, partial [Allosphingosinicella sp.]